MTTEAHSIEMPDIPVPVGSALRRLGYPPGTTTIDGEAGEIFDQLLEQAPRLLKPAGIYRQLHISKRTESQLFFQNITFQIDSAQVTTLLRHSDSALFFMTTIGAALEKEVQQLMDGNEMTRGVMLDAIGSETADACADWIHHAYLNELAVRSELVVTPRFSPGYGDWPVTVQKEIHALCRGELIGIEVSESSLMNPRKSVSAILGFKRKA